MHFESICLPASLGVRLAALLVWTLQAILNALLGCQIGIRMAGACGATEASGRGTAMVFFVLVRASGNAAGLDDKDAVERVTAQFPLEAGETARSLRGFSRKGCWLSLPLPREAAEKELFRSGRSPPQGASENASARKANECSNSKPIVQIKRSF